MTLTKQNVQYINQYLKENHVIFDDIRIELVDHISTAVEFEMVKNTLTKAKQDNDNYKKNKASIDELIERTTELEEEINNLKRQLREKDTDTELINQELRNKKEEYSKCSQTLNYIKADMLANKKTPFVVEHRA